MIALVEIMLGNAVVVAVLGIGLLAIGRIWVRPAVIHFLWVLLLVKLVTPQQFQAPLKLPDVVDKIGAKHDSPARTEPKLIEAADLADFVGDWEGAPILVTRPASEPQAIERAQAAPWLYFAWAGGTLVVASLLLTRMIRFGRLLRRGSHSERHTQIARRVAGKIQAKRIPPVVLVPGKLPPLVWGIGPFTRIVLPEGLLSRIDPAAERALLLHELAHVRRFDHWVRYLEIIVTALYWWHPIVWLARRELREAEEACCDAHVVQAQPNSLRTYATALLDTLDFLAGARVVLPPAASGAGPVYSLRRRIEMVMRGTSWQSWSWKSRLLVAALAVMLVPLGATFADDEGDGQSDGSVDLGLNVTADLAAGDEVLYLDVVDAGDADIADAIDLQLVADVDVDQSRGPGGEVLDRIKLNNDTKPVSVTIEFEDGSKKTLAVKGDVLSLNVKEGEVTVFSQGKAQDRRRRVLLQTSPEGEIRELRIDGNRTAAMIDGSRSLNLEYPVEVDVHVEEHHPHDAHVHEHEEVEHDHGDDVRIRRFRTDRARSYERDSPNDGDSARKRSDDDRLERLEAMLRNLERELRSLKDSPRDQRIR